VVFIGAKINGKRWKENAFPLYNMSDPMKRASGAGLMEIHKIL